jgi:hypothetical protein
VGTRLAASASVPAFPITVAVDEYNTLIYAPDRSVVAISHASEATGAFSSSRDWTIFPGVPGDPYVEHMNISLANVSVSASAERVISVEFLFGSQTGVVGIQFDESREFRVRDSSHSDESVNLKSDLSGRK